MWILSIKVEMMISHFVLNGFPKFQTENGQNTIYKIYKVYTTQTMGQHTYMNMSTYYSKIRWCPSNISQPYMFTPCNWLFQLPDSCWEILLFPIGSWNRKTPIRRVASRWAIYPLWCSAPPGCLSSQIQGLIRYPWESWLRCLTPQKELGKWNID